MKPIKKKPPTGKFGDQASLNLGPTGVARQFGADLAPEEKKARVEALAAARKREAEAKPESQAVMKSRSKDPEGYRAFQRELMRKRRAAKKSGAKA